MTRAVEWNPSGDEWLRADLLHENADNLLIRLRENGQTLTVERRHTRQVPRVWTHGDPANPPRPEPREAPIRVRAANGRTWVQDHHRWRAHAKSRTAWGFWALVEQKGPLTEVLDDPAAVCDGDQP